MMDFELAAKLSGARFVVLQKGLARMERALGQLFLDTHTSEKHGYTEVSPPLMVRDDVMFGTAQLPKFREDQFQTTHEIDQTEVNKSLFEAGTTLKQLLSPTNLETLTPKEKASVDVLAPTVQEIYEKVISSLLEKQRDSLAHPDRRSAAHQSGARVRSSTKTRCRAATPPARRASAPRRAPPARTPAA